MDLVGELTQNLGAASFTALSIALVLYLLYWVIHPQSA